MTYRITLKPAYLSDVVGLPRNVAKRLSKAVAELETAPLELGGNIKKLRGFKNLYRYRIDDHRLIYAVGIESGCVELLAVGIRRDVYARFHATADLPSAPLTPVVVEADRKPAPEGHESGEFEAVGAAPPPTATAIADAERFASAPIPRFAAADLALWRVPEEYHAALLACRSEDDLFVAPCPDLWKERVLDRLFPKPIALVQTQPNLVLPNPAAMDQFVAGGLSAFLLQLDPEQEAIVARSLRGPALVKGGPGSGKSTVAIYRAKALLDGGHASGAGKPPSVLFTTYTNALVAVTEQLLRQLLGARPFSLDVRTTDSVAIRIVRAAGDEVELATDLERRQAVAHARKAVRGGEGEDLEGFLESAELDEIPTDYLLDEFDWIIEGMPVESLDAYLEVARAGRGLAFDREIRRRVWELHAAYEGWLTTRGKVTWGRVRRRALELALASTEHRYDYVLVDEAQDLTPLALRLSVALCRDPAGLFVTADAGQSLYNRGFSFSRVHESLRFTGRTRVLKRNYRTTRQLSLASAAILRGRAGADPETIDLECVREGPRPIAKACVGRVAEYDWLAARIREAARELHLGAGAAAVLCPTRKLAVEAAERLAKAGLPAELMDGKSLRLDAPVAKVLTMHAAKGLEFPIVAIPALEDGVLPWAAERPEEGDENEAAQRRLFYVACSRAMRRLFVATRTGAVSGFVRDLDGTFWDLRLGGEAS